LTSCALITKSRYFEKKHLPKGVPTEEIGATREKLGRRPTPKHLGLDLVGRIQPTRSSWSLLTMLTTRPVARRVLSRIPPLTRIAPLFTRVADRRAASTISVAPFAPLDTFQERHVGPDAREVSQMLKVLGYDCLDAFVADTVPQHIRTDSSAVSSESIPPLSESELLKRAGELAAQNKPFRSYIGMGYWNAVVPPVILRNVSVLYSLEPLMSISLTSVR
jgi:Glycine cleavage system P-protein